MYHIIGFLEIQGSSKVGHFVSCFLRKENCGFKEGAIINNLVGLSLSLMNNCLKWQSFLCIVE
eukprot:snap_masked-scaffold_49-processed-gene-0.12-mRNA-1 protein AED:1.00 eAED:1.00 QI:0/0/0/0/1/1/6/0/62